MGIKAGGEMTRMLECPARKFDLLAGIQDAENHLQHPEAEKTCQLIA